MGYYIKDQDGLYIVENQVGVWQMGNTEAEQHVQGGGYVAWGPKPVRFESLDDVQVVLDFCKSSDQYLIEEVD